MIAEVVAIEDRRWAESLQRITHDVYHLPAYISLEAQRQGAEAVGLIAEGVHDVLILPLLLRPVGGSHVRDAVSPYGYPGPLCSTDDPLFLTEAVAAVTETLRQLGVVSCFVRLHPLHSPRLPAGLASSALVQQGDTVVIDLSRSEEALWRQTRNNHRRQIGQARRAGLVVHWERWGELDAFVTMYAQTMTRVGAEAGYFFPRGYFIALRDRLAGAVRLLTVHDATGPIAGGIFTECSGTMQYHLGATADGHLALNPTKLMFAEAITSAKARGNRWLHLGGGVGTEDDSLLHFKAGFSDLRLRYTTWRVVVDERRYRSLRPTGTAPNPAAEYFPEYRHPRDGEATETCRRALAASEHS